MIPTPRHMPTHIASVRLGAAGDEARRVNGRNIDGIKALALTTAEAAAFSAAVREAITTATDADWAAEVFTRMEANPYRGVTRPTAQGWQAYSAASFALDLEAAEGILQHIIARA